MKGNNLIDLLKAVSNSDTPTPSDMREQIEYIDIGQIESDPGNFYKLTQLEELAVKTAHQKGKRVSAETLRNICGDGAPKIPLEDWLKIEKALNTLEQKGS